MHVLKGFNNKQYFLLHTLYVLTGARIYFHFITFVYEEWYAYFCTVIQFRWFQGVGSSIAFQTRLAIIDHQLHKGWRLS
jgi:hypothetical protein